MSRRTTDYNKAGVAASMGTGTIIAMGVGAGFIGVGIMTLTQKLEQMFTNRPNSLVPGLALARLLGKPDSEKGAMMWPMHWGAVSMPELDPIIKLKSPSLAPLHQG
jgi:hypothetical protein